jgi:hypothetical protein
MNHIEQMRTLIEAVSNSVEGDIVASAGHFTVVDDGNWIHLLDGEDTVRASMPRLVWEDLISSYQPR